MKINPIVLEGHFIRLEPLDLIHTTGLAAASAVDPALYRWSPVSQGKDEVVTYIETALAWREAGSAVPFAIIRLADGDVIGSTRFWNIEYWNWPMQHARHLRTGPDVCEIGYTWLTASVIRTAANTEAKLLTLTYAFEVWKVLRVCFHTDIRNERSRAALQRIGGRFEGTLRAHRMAADFIPRDSARYSILAEEWSGVKVMLQSHIKKLQHP
jgi:RimJ/RimL family protein N-acetyltransferase